MAAAHVMGLAEDIRIHRRSRDERFAALRAAVPERGAVGFLPCPGVGCEPAMREFGQELASDGNRVVLADLSAIQFVTRRELEAFDRSDIEEDRDGLYRWRGGAAGAPQPCRSRASAPSADPCICCMELLRSGFEYTLIDAPAVDAGLNAVVLAAIADAVVLVAEAGKSRAEEIERARAALEMAGAKLAGCVLTGRRKAIPSWIERFLR